MVCVPQDGPGQGDRWTQMLGKFEREEAGQGKSEVLAPRSSRSTECPANAQQTTHSDAEFHSKY